MKTQNIHEVPMDSYKYGMKSDGFHTKSRFFFNEGGVEYYVDNIGSDLGHMKLRNSNTGQSRIYLLSELRTGRHQDTYFFSYD